MNEFETNRSSVLFITGSEIKEYCLADHFHGRCDTGEVIMMKTAVFGRMRIGKCMVEDLGKHSILLL